MSNGIAFRSLRKVSCVIAAATIPMRRSRDVVGLAVIAHVMLRGSDAYPIHPPSRIRLRSRRVQWRGAEHEGSRFGRLVWLQRDLRSGLEGIRARVPCAGRHRSETGEGEGG